MGAQVADCEREIVGISAKTCSGLVSLQVFIRTNHSYRVALDHGFAGRVHGLPHHRQRKGTGRPKDRKSTRLNSSHQIISYAVFCLKKKKCRTYTWPGPPGNDGYGTLMPLRSSTAWRSLSNSPASRMGLDKNAPHRGRPRPP